MSVPEEIQFKESHEAKKDEVSHFNFDANNRPTKVSYLLIDHGAKSVACREDTYSR